MSKKVQKSPKKGAGTNKDSPFPMCLNKNEARMVCLSQQCEEYPFFCSICEDSSCEIAHQHDDKLVSVSYKQFTKRVLKERKPGQPLANAMDSYRKVLEKLKEDVSEFIEKELAQLDEIVKKAEEIPQDDSELINKLKNQQYQGLTGSMMDQLWTSCAQDPEKQQAQQQTAEFIKIKEEQVKGISEHFEHLNQMDFDNIPEDKEQQAGPKDKKAKVSTSQTKPKK